MEVPDGTEAVATEPSSAINNASTVGIPRESKIWRAWMDFMVDMFCKRTNKQIHKLTKKLLMNNNFLVYLLFCRL